MWVGPVGQGELEPRVERLQGDQTQMGDRTLSIRGPLDRRIVVNHDMPVRGGVDIKLQAIRTRGNPRLKRRQRIFWKGPRRAAMGEQTWAGAVEEARDYSAS